MVQYSTKMIFAVLDVSLIIMGLNIGETDKLFYINYHTMITGLSVLSPGVPSTKYFAEHRNLIKDNKTYIT